MPNPIAQEPDDKLSDLVDDVVGAARLRWTAAHGPTLSIWGAR